MRTFTVTMTDLKNNTSDILNKVYYKGKIARITRHGKIIAYMEPIKRKS